MSVCAQQCPHFGAGFMLVCGLLGLVCACVCADRLVTAYRDLDGCSTRAIIRGNQIHN